LFNFKELIKNNNNSSVAKISFSMPRVPFGRLTFCTTHTSETRDSFLIHLSMILDLKNKEGG